MSDPEDWFNVLCYSFSRRGYWRWPLVSCHFCLPLGTPEEEEEEEQG